MHREQSEEVLLGGGGSWLNIAEIEQMRSEVKAWNINRNNSQTKVDWQFKTEDARIKLKRLYPIL